MTVSAEPRRLQTACPLDCPDACSLEVTVAGDRLERVDAGDANPATAGYICGKVRRIGRHVHGEERLLSPGIRRGAKGEGLFEPLEWDEALGLVAERLVQARERSGGEAILPLSYGGSNGFLSQGVTDARLFHRLGASVLERTVCAAPTGAAAAGLYGKMHGVAYADYEAAELIVIWGANPSASGIHLVPHVRRALDRGARLVVVDPRRTPLAKKADLHLALRPGTDLPVALSLIRWLFESGAADGDFLARHATGVPELRERAAPWTFERAAAEAGLAAADLERFARLYAETRPAVLRCGWGLERNRNGGSAAAAVLALPAVAGHFGVRGGGFTLSNGAAWKLPTGALAEPPDPGLRRVNMNHVGRALLEQGDPPIEVLFVYNANPLATLPQQGRVRRGLEREDLFTVVFDQVLTDTARYADVVLPATTFLEHDELHRGYGSTALQRIRPVLPPVGAARSNLEVFAELCRRTGVHREGDLEDPGELVSALVDGEVLEALEAGRAAVPACGPAPVQFADVFPGTADRKVHLCPAELDREAPRGLYGYRADPATAEFPLALISPATAQRTSSTFGQLDRREARLGIHPGDAAPRGIADGDPVRVFDATDAVRCAAELDADLRPGTVLLSKGLWDHNTRSGNTACALAPDTLADLGGGACFNDARVQVERDA